MRLLIADRFPDAQREVLTALGHVVTYDPELAAETLGAALAGHDVVVVRSTKVTADALAAADTLRLVIRAGSGTDTIDREAASVKGVAVCNVPGRNAIAVAELAFGLLLALDRRIPDQVADLRDGRWRKKTYQQARGIAGRKVGIVGLGEIGLSFAERAVAFDCQVFGLHRSGRPEATAARIEAMGMTMLDDLPTLANTCDTLSFHVPLSDDTRGLIGTELLAHVQRGATLINTSRGELVDEAALLTAIEEKHLRVGLDVYPDEPAAAEADYTSRLATHPNVVGTHHVGASTEQAQVAVADGVVEIVTAFAEGRRMHCINEDALASVGH